MLQPRLLASILITGLLSISPVASYNTSVNYITDGGAQYIYYPGKITGTFTHNTTRYDDPYKDFRDEVEYPCGDNGTYYWDLVKNLDVPPYMRIGVNAPWDTNPFFFSLHRGVDDRFRDDEEEDDDDLPHPPLPELEFTTAHFECLKDGALCGDLKLKPWEYVPLEEVDLWAATVSQVKGEGGSAKGSFYAVAGDERSWVGDGRVLRNRARFQQPKNYSTTADCVKEVDIVWSVYPSLLLPGAGHTPAVLLLINHDAREIGEKTPILLTPSTLRTRLLRRPSSSLCRRGCCLSSSRVRGKTSTVITGTRRRQLRTRATGAKSTIPLRCRSRLALLCRNLRTLTGVVWFGTRTIRGGGT